MKIMERVFAFDSGHRVVNHESKCNNYHGHRYYGVVRLAYKDEKEIGFTIDFSDIKAIANGWIDKFMDHGMILNPIDPMLLDFESQDMKIYKMTIGGVDHNCNPTAENIVKEMLCAMNLLFEKVEGISVHSIKLSETPNCSVDVKSVDVEIEEQVNFNYAHESKIKRFLNELSKY